MAAHKWSGEIGYKIGDYIGQLYTGDLYKTRKISHVEYTSNF